MLIGSSEERDAFIKQIDKAAQESAMIDRQKDPERQWEKKHQRKEEEQRKIAQKREQAAEAEGKQKLKRF